MNFLQIAENMVENHDITVFDYAAFLAEVENMTAKEVRENFNEVFFKYAKKFKWSIDRTSKSFQLTIKEYNFDASLKNIVTSHHADYHSANMALQKYKTTK